MTRLVVRGGNSHGLIKKISLTQKIWNTTRSLKKQNYFDANRVKEISHKMFRRF